jgi:hypothetical protein
MLCTKKPKGSKCFTLLPNLRVCNVSHHRTRTSTEDNTVLPLAAVYSTPTCYNRQSLHLTVQREVRIRQDRKIAIRAVLADVMVGVKESTYESNIFLLLVPNLSF